MRIWNEVVSVFFSCSPLHLLSQEELSAAFKKAGIDPAPYYWYTDQVSVVYYYVYSHVCSSLVCCYMCSGSMAPALMEDMG